MGANKVNNIYKYKSKCAQVYKRPQECMIDACDATLIAEQGNQREHSENCREKEPSNDSDMISRLDHNYVDDKET
jgi:hypothetical protein